MLKNLNKGTRKVATLLPIQAKNFKAFLDVFYVLRECLVSAAFILRRRMCGRSKLLALGWANSRVFVAFWQ